MSLLPARDRAFVGAVSRLAYGNPFLPERIDHERQALGSEFAPAESVWSVGEDAEIDSANVQKIERRAEDTGSRLRARLADGSRPSDEEAVLYEDLVIYVLYHRYRSRLFDRVGRTPGGKAGRERVPFYDAFVRDAHHFLSFPGTRFPALDDLPHLFACFFQVRRAFQHIFADLVGGSMPAALLRAAAWQSIFTHDLRRYRRALFHRMGDITTLVTGPSGTGKELVARAIALSRYVAFDPRAGAFIEDPAEAFRPLNLSALSPMLIESELFGHRRGAFTGAVADRAGWLEVCPPLGTVFLDEIGEIDVPIQVKLLRVLDTRAFQRVGDTAPLRFHGKIIAATNRDLAREMQAGRFREDLYYRICSDVIVTPSLREQVRDAPGEMPRLIRFVARRLVGDEAEALAAEAERWIERHLGPDYAWPGNVRELEQCVRNVLVRETYSPSRPPAKTAQEDLAEAVIGGTLTADELMRRYCTRIYAEVGSYEETARRLGLDRRTVKSKVDAKRLEAFRTAAK